jgi:guanine deaminase
MSRKATVKGFMEMAVKEGFKGMRDNEGGPFGAVIVKDGRVIAKGHNRVVKTKDPTDHAEIVAIRQASKKLRRFDLSDCEIYSTCEPCPMCLAALYWARIRRIYYGCTKEDAAKIGFADESIDAAIKGKLSPRKLRMISMEREGCLKLFAAWEQKLDKVPY